MNTDKKTRLMENQSLPLPAITLRPFERSSSAHFDAIMEFGTDRRVIRTLHTNLFSGREDAARFIETVILPSPWFRFIFQSGAAASDRPIGSINLRQEDAGGGRLRVSVGYSVVPEFWGRGVATAAVRMATAAAFEMWAGVERVHALVYLDNPASQRVLEKAGFEREAIPRRYIISKGVIRDLAMYSLITAD